MADLTGYLGLLGLISTFLDLLEKGFIAADRKDDVTKLGYRLDQEGFFLAIWAANPGIIENNGNNVKTIHSKGRPR